MNGWKDQRQFQRAADEKQGSSRSRGSSLGLGWIEDGLAEGPGERRHGMHRLARLWIVGTTIALVAFGAVSPATAETPSNDSRAGALEVGSLPFSHSQDTGQATPSGPKQCGNSGSVFFRFVPTVTGPVQVDTIGSGYDTILTVFRTTDHGPEVIRCSDDHVYRWGATRFKATAGVEYFLMPGRCCGSGRRGGGDLVLNVTEVTQAPFEASVTVEGGTVDPATGIVTLALTVNCTHVSWLVADGELRQLRSEIFVARGWFGTESLYCLPGSPNEWTAEVDTETGVAFGTGDARIRWGSIELRDFSGWLDVTPEVSTPVTVTDG